MLILTHLASANTNIWSGASGVDLFWSTAGNWSPSGPPGVSDDARFNDTGAALDAVTINNIISVNRVVQSLTFGQTNGFHNTLINPGVTLTVANNAAANLLVVGTETGVSASQQETATISGPGGKLVVNSASSGSALVIREAYTSSGTHRATLDMSGLDTFEATVGRVLVAVQGSIVRPAGTWLLARTNTISVSGTAPAFALGDGSSNGGNAIAQLGETNAIFADSFAVARQKSNSRLEFNPAFTSSGTPVVVLRGRTASRVSNFSIGDNSAQTSSGTATTGTVDLSGGILDAQVDACYIARGQAGTGTGGATGNLTFGSGVLDVNTLEVGYLSAATAAGSVTGTVNVNGTATLRVNNNLRLGQNPGAAATATGTLNINGGTVRASSITSGAGAVNSTINLTSGLLAVTNSAGSPAAPIVNFNASDSTLEFAVSPNATNLVVIYFADNLSTTNNTINVSALPPIYSYPAQIPLISYLSYYSVYDMQVGSMPAALPAYAGYYLSNNAANGTIDLVIASGPATVAPRALTWNGNLNGDWNTSTANWLLSASSTAYNQGDFVTFGDGASGTTTINLTTNLAPGSLLVSNITKSYIFTGTGSIGGSFSMTKEGAGSLTLANSGGDTFSGVIALNEGSLIYDRSGTSVESHDISGAGAVVKNGDGTLTLSGGNTYGGGSTVNGGTLRLGNVNSAGTGDLIVYAGATLVVGASQANGLTLSNATLGGSAGATLSGALTIPASTTTTIYAADPQNLSTLANLILTGPLSGSGNINVLAGTNNTVNPDNTTGACRFNATMDGGYSGRITFGNRVKAEIRDTPAYDFSSAGTATLVLTCGTSAGGSTQNGDFCNLLIRNDAGASGIFGNNVELAGSGLAALNPLGTAAVGSLSTMGNLKIGNGQDLGVYRNGGNVMTLVFPTVTLTGGTATFSPRPAGFAASVNGSDLSLGDISQTTASGILMAGLRTLSITGTASYTGATTVSNGTLNVSGSLAGSGAVAVAGGTLAGVGTVAGPVTIQSGGTLAPGTVQTGVNQSPDYGIGTLTLNGSLTLAGNVLIEVDNSLLPSSDVVTVTGALTYGGTLTATNIGAGPLSLGDQFQIFKAGGAGGFTSILGSPGAGLSWSFNPATGVLSVANAAPPTLGVSQTGNVLTFTWAEAGYKLQSQTNSLSVGIVPGDASWFDYPGGDTSGVTATMDPGNPTVFFRLTSP